MKINFITCAPPDFITNYLTLILMERKLCSICVLISNLIIMNSNHEFTWIFNLKEAQQIIMWFPTHPPTTHTAYTRRTMQQVCSQPSWHHVPQANHAECPRPLAPLSNIQQSTAFLKCLRSCLRTWSYIYHFPHHMTNWLHLHQSCFIWTILLS